MTRLLGLNVDLDCPVGLKLTEAARANCRGWLGVEVQRCIVPLLQSTPLKMTRQQIGRGGGDCGVSLQNRLTDSAGNSVYLTNIRHSSLASTSRSYYEQSSRMTSVVQCSRRWGHQARARQCTWTLLISSVRRRIGTDKVHIRSAWEKPSSAKVSITGEGSEIKSSC